MGKPFPAPGAPTQCRELGPSRGGPHLSCAGAGGPARPALHWRRRQRVRRPCHQEAPHPTVSPGPTHCETGHGRRPRPPRASRTRCWQPRDSIGGPHPAHNPAKTSTTRRRMYPGCRTSRYAPPPARILPAPPALPPSPAAPLAVTPRPQAAIRGRGATRSPRGAGATSDTRGAPPSAVAGPRGARAGSGLRPPWRGGGAGEAGAGAGAGGGAGGGGEGGGGGGGVGAPRPRRRGGSGRRTAGTDQGRPGRRSGPIRADPRPAGAGPGRSGPIRRPRGRPRPGPGPTPPARAGPGRSTAPGAAPARGSTDPDRAGPIPCPTDFPARPRPARCVLENPAPFQDPA